MSFQSEAKLNPISIYPMTLSMLKRTQIQNLEEISGESNTFTEHCQTFSLIEYNKIVFSNCQLLDKQNTNIVAFLQSSTLANFHHQILDDIFKEFAVNMFSSKSVKKRH